MTKFTRAEKSLMVSLLTDALNMEAVDADGYGAAIKELAASVLSKLAEDEDGEAKSG